MLRDGHGTRVGAGYGGHAQILIFHCVSHQCEIHQRALIGKAVDFSHAKTLVTRTVALFTRVISSISSVHSDASWQNAAGFMDLLPGTHFFLESDNTCWTADVTHMFGAH